MASRSSTTPRDKGINRYLSGDLEEDHSRDLSEGCGEGSAVRRGPHDGAASGPDDYLRHPRMDLGLRAKIFIPFEPLRGFREALRKRERQAGAIARVDLPPERQERISRDLANLVPGDTVSVTHYMGDHYGMTQGLVEGLFASDEELVVAGRRIGFRDISAIEVLDG
mgnify:CR=1 FL=1